MANKSPEESKKMREAYSKIIAKAWSDSAFKQKLKQNPAAVLQEYGIPLASGCKVHVHENSEKEIHFVLPVKPSEAVSEQDLHTMAGGSCFFCACTCHGSGSIS